MKRQQALDESSVNTNMTRLRGRAKGGERCLDKAPHKRRGTMSSILGSIRSDGSSECLMIQGTVNSLVFRSYINEVLLPILHPEDIVIADNLSVHNDLESKAMIETVGATLLFMPPYSPDLNPIEMMWSKVKALLRGVKSRTQKLLQEAISAALATISSDDAHGWCWVIIASATGE